MEGRGAEDGSQPSQERTTTVPLSQAWMCWRHTVELCTFGVEAARKLTPHPHPMRLAKSGPVLAFHGSQLVTALGFPDKDITIFGKDKVQLGTWKSPARCW